MQITGRIKMIGQMQEVSQSFKKRELVVTTDEQYAQHILIEFHQDKCEVLNQFQVGQQVTVDLNLRGREWVNPQGETKYFNTIQGWRISTPQQQPQQGYTQQPNYQQPQQGYTNTGYHGNGSATQAYFNQQSHRQNHPQQGYGQQQSNEPPF